MVTQCLTCRDTGWKTNKRTCSCPIGQAMARTAEEIEAVAALAPTRARSKAARTPRLERTDAKVELSKRIHAPYKMHSACPVCQREIVKDLGQDHHLLQSAPGAPAVAYFTCDREHEEAEWQVKVRIDLVLSLIS